jgi:hypothetical protein
VSWLGSLQVMCHHIGLTFMNKFNALPARPMAARIAPHVLSAHCLRA